MKLATPPPDPQAAAAPGQRLDFSGRHGTVHFNYTIFMFARKKFEIKTESIDKIEVRSQIKKYIFRCPAQLSSAQQSRPCSKRRKLSQVSL